MLSFQITAVVDFLVRIQKLLLYKTNYNLTYDRPKAGFEAKMHKDRHIAIDGLH